MRIPMFILRPIADRLIKRAQAGGFDRRHVGDGRGSVFFYRHRIFKSRLISVFLHEFVRGDGDRCLHDHPWSFLAILLRGGYWETIVPERRGEHPVRWRPPGSVLYRPAEFAHRIDLADFGVKPWSFVVVGPKVREWGFFTLQGWKAWVTGQPNPICATDAFDNARMAAHSTGLDAGDLADVEDTAEYPAVPAMAKQPYGPEPVTWRGPIIP